MSEAIAFDEELEVQNHEFGDEVLVDITAGERFHLNGAEDFRRIADLLNEAADTLEEDQ